MRLSRRLVIVGTAALVAMPACTAATDTDAKALLGSNALWAWWALDLGSGRTMGENPDLQLPMCSSFKWLLASMVLSRVDRGIESLKRTIQFGPKDIVFNSPTVEGALKAAGGSMSSLSIRDLCQATVTLSDSAAANLLLPTVGGPAGLTAWLRRIGDPVTRLDRYELDLNRVPPGDVRDTTTPRASVGNLHYLLYGGGLKQASKALMLDWLYNARPGASRMPAGLRSGWRIGHKTGTWMVDAGHGPTERAASADVAILLPNKGRPVLIAAFTAGSERSQAQIDRWFAGLVAKTTSSEWLHRAVHDQPPG
ncbi:MAG: class A beta-lactamase [Pseudomonadota bacterium]